MTPPDELPEIHWPGRVLDARLQLLDRLIHDIHEVPLGTVDDIMLDGLPVGQDIPRDAPPPVVTGLLTGPVLATRIFGGRPSESRLTFIDWGLVQKLGTVVTLRVTHENVESTWAERWLRDNVIGRIPGGRHGPE